MASLSPVRSAPKGLHGDDFGVLLTILPSHFGVLLYSERRLVLLLGALGSKNQIPVHALACENTRQAKRSICSGAHELSSTH